MSLTLSGQEPSQRPGMGDVVYCQTQFCAEEPLRIAMEQFFPPASATSVRFLRHLIAVGLRVECSNMSGLCCQSPRRPDTNSRVCLHVSGTAVVHCNFYGPCPSIAD